MPKNENKYFAKVIKVLDGDTFDVMIDLGFGVKQEFRVRLNGIDTPELNTAKGKKALEFVKELIENKTVILHDAGQEKYGRARANVELMDGSDLSTLLIEKNIGVEYHGGKKENLKLFAELTAVGTPSNETSTTD